MRAKTSKGDIYTFTLIDDEDGNEDGIIDDFGTCFQQEQRFKLAVKDIDGGEKGEIEGCYLNSPMNTMIIGQFTIKEETSSYSIINFAM